MTTPTSPKSHLSILTIAYQSWYFHHFISLFYLGILVQENWKAFSWIKNVPSALLEGMTVFIWDYPTGGHWERQQGSVCWWLQGGWTVISVSRVGWCVARSCLPHWCFWDPTVTAIFLFWHFKILVFPSCGLLLLLSLFMFTACVRFTP